MFRRFLLALFLLAPAALMQAKEPAWLKVRSEHFEIYSAENEKKARKVLEHLERVRKAFELLTNVRIKTEERVRVLLFRNEREYREYAPSKLASAYYMNARGRDHIVLSDFDERTELVLNHEYFHLFSKHAGFRFPVWLEEGLADFYSTLKIGKKDVSLGLPVVGHLMYLNSLQGTPMPLRQIVAVDGATRHEHGQDLTSRLYAQGWALAHMTFQGKEMSSRSQAFLAKIRDGQMDTAAAYQATYGYSIEQLDKLLAQYIRQQSYYYGKMDAENLDFVAPTEMVPVADWETPLLLADMLAYVRKPDEAKARYAALSAEFPERPEIDESRGYLEWHQLDREEAAKHFREAARKKSGNSMLYYQLAATACDYYVANDECRGWINEALRLDPANKQARQWAVGYALNIKDFDGAIVYMVRGGPVAAGDAPDFFHKLAYAHYAKGNFKEAHAAAKRGLEFARKPEDQQRLINLERNITMGEEYAAKVREVREGVPAGVAGAATGPGRTAPGASGAPAAQGNVQKGIGAEAAKISQADYAVEQFILEDGAVMTAATMEAMECGGAQPKVLVKAKGAPLRLVVDNPSAVIVIRDGEVVVNHEFVCGKQKPVALLVGYLKGDAPDGSDGRLRILSFQ